MSLRLCRSEKVKNPYYVSFLGMHLYSSQELAYVIYHYPLLVMDCLVNESLLDFLREELNMGFLALKLENWEKSGEDPDEMLIFLLQESDYYSQNEISEYRQTLSGYRKQPPAEMKKLKADALFGMRQYGKAVRLYQEILDDLQEETGSDELAAAVWNNLGACYGRMFLFARAAEAYEKAYNRSGSRECLRSLYWIEKLDSNPGELIPEEMRHAGEGAVVKINLNQSMADILKELTKYPVATRLSLNGTIIVGRDIAHAKLKERLDRGEDLPQYIKDHPIYYAGPAKTPAGMSCGSMGPTTAGRMDSYVELFQSHGGSMVMLAKGNRSQQVTDACKKYGGFYLGSIGGPAAILAQNNIKSIECVEYPELGMEAIWKIEVEDFPAFILVDDKGNDFFKQLKPWNCSK